jgi:biofilm PGA synthesis N-glycosyltransferase PgaC
MLWPALFAAGILLIFYCLFGYPAILALLTPRHPRLIHRQLDHFKTVSILVAVHNGERYIRDKLNSILSLNYPNEYLQVLVISDGSTDATEQIVAQYASSGVHLIRTPRGGKAAALNAGMQQASGEILLLTDVRQRLDTNSLCFLVESFADPQVGAVSGELVIHRGDTREEIDLGLYWRYELWIRKRLSQIDSIFGASGALYAIRRELASPMPPGTLLDDVHLPLGAFFQGYRLIIDGRALAYDHPTRIDAEFYRKVRTLAGNYQILRAYPALLGPRNRMWFHFLSYKFGRLMLPYALLLVAVASIRLAWPWNAWTAAAQAAFYGLALLDMIIPQHWPLKRLSSPIRTFVVLMAATLCAIAIFFVPSTRLWKQTGQNHR